MLLSTQISVMRRNVKGAFKFSEHARQLERQIRFDGRPLGSCDGIDGGVADGAVGQNHMRPEHAVEFGTQSFNGATALIVHEMRAEFHCDAI